MENFLCYGSLVACLIMKKFVHFSAVCWQLLVVQQLYLPWKISSADSFMNSGLLTYHTKLPFVWKLHGFWQLDLPWKISSNDSFMCSCSFLLPFPPVWQLHVFWQLDLPYKTSSSLKASWLLAVWLTLENIL